MSDTEADYETAATSWQVWADGAGIDGCANAPSRPDGDGWRLAHAFAAPYTFPLRYVGYWERKVKP